MSLQPEPIAIALYYDGEHAPRVTAKGAGHVAREILDLAHAHGVPVRTSPAMAQALSQVALDTEIPEPLYRAVAEIIAFAYLLTGRAPPGR
ncbi:MAG: EscU/YscU/HrcU family type III secretion system export apparatus switch protein [Gammaproteobacteria bacterium]